MKKIILAFLAALFCTTAAIAAPLGDSGLPVDITADSMVYDADKNNVVFQGKVEATRGDFKMWSEMLTLYLKSDDKEKKGPTGMEGGDLDRIVAEKNVRFKNGPQTGTASKATYFAGRNMLVLEGNPILHDGDNSIRGSVIRYFVDENRSVVEGSSKQRVHAVFSNEKKGK